MPKRCLAQNKLANSYPINEWTERGKGTVIPGTRRTLRLGKRKCEGGRGGVTFFPRETKEESLRWSSPEKETVGVLNHPRGQRVDRQGAGSGCEGFALSTDRRSPAWEITRAAEQEGGGGSKGAPRLRRETGPPRGQKGGGDAVRRCPIESSSRRSEAEGKTQRESGAWGSEGMFKRPKRRARHAPGRSRTW